jgi:hypothetical protein
VDVTYVARRCPTKTGWVEHLVESEEFTDYYQEWVITPVSNGIHLMFLLRTEIDIPVPASIMRAALKRSVKKSLVTIRGDLGGPREP